MNTCYSSILVSIVLVVLVTLLSVVAQVSTAEHTPVAMSFESMFKEAKHVWAGTILEVDHKDHDQEGFVQWTNRHYQVTVNISSVAKTRGYHEKEAMYHRYEETEQEIRHKAEGLPPHQGAEAVEHPEHVVDPLHDDETLNIGDIIHVHYWAAISRPPGYQFPDSPGVKGMREDLNMEVGKTFVFFGEYLNRDRVRQYMYAHTHPGKVRRRKHIRGSSSSKSQSESQAEEGKNSESPSETKQQEEQQEFTFVRAYIPFIPDGITDNIGPALNAGKNSETRSSGNDL